MKKLLIGLAVLAMGLVAYPVQAHDHDSRVTFYGNISATTVSGDGFSLADNTQGSFGFGVKYALDGGSFRVVAGFREVPVFGGEVKLSDGGKAKAAQIGLEKGYDLGFNEGFMGHISLVLRLMGSDVLNDGDNFDAVGGIGFEKRLNVKDGAAILSIMPYLDVTDMAGSNIITVGVQFNVTPPPKEK